MFVENRGADPQIHRAAIRLACQCTDVVSTILRPEERQEYYRIIREGLEQFRREDNS